jgi:hypothetical protein
MFRDNYTIGIVFEFVQGAFPKNHPYTNSFKKTITRINYCLWQKKRGGGGGRLDK